MLRLVAALALVLAVVPGVAEARIKLDRAFRFPAGKPIRIVVLRPDVKVGTMGAGGVEEANADWTATARAKLVAQVEANRKGSGQEVIFLPDQEGDRAQLVADYQALFRTVAAAVVSHTMTPGASLPTKKDAFDWTLGTGAARLGEIGGGDYALFLSTRDAYGTTGRKAMQLFAAVLFGAAMPAGIHQSYAALVDLKTGNLVWINVDPGSGGDVRTDEGATKRVGQLMNEFPAVEGAAPAPAPAKGRGEVIALVALALALAPVGSDLKTPVGAGYLPADKDERGLWMQVEESERLVKTSAFTVHDPALEGYVRGVFCRTVGAERCAGVRIYLVRTPDFNASMAPNGMMIVNTGLLLRMQDEAQLAAILGHEYTHYANRHTLQGFRDLRGKATAMSWLSMIPVGGYAAAAAISLAQIGMLSSYFGFSRSMEAEADAGSIPLMAQAGYDPGAAWHVWDQLRAEQDATAAARKKRSRKDDDRGLFGSHPPTADRLAALKAMAEAQPVTGTRTDGRAAYRAALAPWWPRLVDDQIKLNDFGATDFLIGRLAKDGWTADLLYARGELYRTRGRPDDLVAAAGFYRQAIALPGAPAESWRGLGLVQMRGGDESAGRAALAHYLAVRPEAPDRSMIAMIAGEGA